MAKKQYDLSSGLSWLGTILQYIRDYGVCSIFKALIIMFMLSITLRIYYDPTFLFDKYSKYMNQKHSQELLNRIDDDKKVKDLLPRLLYMSGADRVWVIQYHNGISDWLNLPDYLKTHNQFIGNLTTLEQIDHVMYDRFGKNNVEYLACILLKDDTGTPIGILGFTWEKENEVGYEDSTIKENLIRYGAIIEQYIKPNIINNAKIK